MNGLELFVISAAIWASSPVSGTEINYDDSAECLAKNIYYEARNQGTAGWMAVTAVVLNRVNDSRFPNTICEVVEQGPTRPSWKNANIKIPVKNRRFWYRAVSIRKGRTFLKLRFQQMPV